VGSKTLHQQNPPVLNRRCRQTQVDLYTHTHPFNGPLSGTTWVRRYQKGKTSLDFIEARNSERQWHQLGHMQVCTSLQTENHASTPPLSFLQAGRPSCHTTNSVKALKGYIIQVDLYNGHKTVVGWLLVFLTEFCDSTATSWTSQ